MRKRNKTILKVLGVLVLVALIAYFGGFLAITTQDTTFYSNIQATANSILLSSPINQVLYHNQVYAADYTGNTGADLNDFRNNKVMLPFYLNFLNVNANDFNVAVNQPSCVLYPNYCQAKPSGDKVSQTGLDANDCPLYAVYQRTQPACCAFGQRLTGSDLIGWSVPQCLAPGSNGGAWSDCSTYSFLSNSGGTKDSTDRSQEIKALTSNGWYYDSGNACFVGGDPNSNNVMSNAAKTMSCSASGTLTKPTGDSVAYQFNGQITGWEGKYGFGCFIPDSKFAALPSFSGQSIPVLTQASVKFQVGNVSVSEYPTVQPSAQVTTQAQTQPVSAPSQPSATQPAVTTQQQTAQQPVSVNQNNVQNVPSPTPSSSLYPVIGFIIFMVGGIIFFVLKRHGR